MKPRVLIARLDSDGDVLLAGPAVRAVAAGARHLTLLCGPRGRQAAELLPGVDDVREFDAPWIDPEPAAVDPAAVSSLVTGLRALELDEAIVLTSFHQSPLPLALLMRLAGVPTIAATSEDYPGSLLDVRHRAPEDVHEVERSLSLVATLGHRLPRGDDGALAVRLPAGDRFRHFDGPYVVVHPGASVSARAWAPERHRRLVAALAAGGRSVIVTGGPSERELTSHVAGRPSAAVVDLGGRTSLAELAGVLAGADAVVVGNTGPAHLASAVGTAVVSLYAPTVPPARWRPWGVPHALLHSRVPCAGCRARTCPVPGHPCLGDVQVEDVLAALEGVAPAALPGAMAS